MIVEAHPSSSLRLSVLVLNKLYMAVHIISVRRAFILLVKDLAEVVSVQDGQWETYDFSSWLDAGDQFRDEPDAEADWVRAVSFDIPAPRIIRLLSYDRIPKHPVKFNRRNIFARDEYRCAYCHKNFSVGELTLDHVVPRSQNGKTTWENVVTCCVRCNVKKGGRTPEQAGMKLHRKEIKPKTNPVVNSKLSHRRYRSWKPFLETSPCVVDTH
ncbi:HNH endonuclease [Planctomycetes bacterium Pan216]|uniref:HNH endonuclease n=1 Tax=Kolteria novifilia TaxID=2527975 RepID=A0A518BBP1_9BACT|nr:HNH endonuclease [Planctomycetes bacterium Pan216]